MHEMPMSRVLGIASFSLISLCSFVSGSSTYGGSEKAFSPTVTITSINPTSAAQGSTLNVTINGTGFESGADVDFILTRGNTTVGGYGIWDLNYFTNWLTGSTSTTPQLEMTRNILNAWDMPDEENSLWDVLVQRFEDAVDLAANGPIEIAYTLRWPESVDQNGQLSMNDVPPATNDTDYLTVRTNLKDLLNTTAAQSLISNGRFRLMLFNEVCGGPGTIVSDQDHTRAIALATDLRTYLRNNVTNGTSIKFSSAALTATAVVHPDVVLDPADPNFLVKKSRQDRMRQWIIWAADNDEIVDLHLQVSSINDPESDRDFVLQIEAVRAFAESYEWEDFKWGSGEFGPTNYPIEDYQYPTQQELQAVEVFEHALWRKAYEYKPVYLLRTPFFEQSNHGYINMWSSIMYNDCPSANVSFLSRLIPFLNPPCAKQPFANILASQFDLPMSDSTIVVNNVTFMSSSQMVANISVGGTSPITLRDVSVSNPEQAAVSLEDGFSVSEAKE